MRVTWVGHATVLIELDGTRLLTDPLLRDSVAHLRRRRHAVLPDLSRLDAVLVSHPHRDHLDWPSVAMLSPDTPIVAPARVPARFRARQRVIEMAPRDEVTFGMVKVTATPAEHDGRRVPLGPRRAALGYRIDGTRTLYFAGDTGLFDEMAAIGNAGLDVALLPIWGWGSRLPGGHLSPLSAAEALRLLRPRIAIPIHWGTFARIPTGRRPPGHSDEPPREFARHAAAIAPDVKIVVLQPGGAVDV